MEHFDALGDDSLLRELELPILPLEAHDENPANRFVYDDYDWDGFEAEGQVTVRLNRGYFTFIGEEDVEKIKGRTPFAHVHNCPRTGKLLSVRAALKVGGKWTFLHRYLMSAKKGSIIEHGNNLPMDNRRLKNLWNSNSTTNNANRFRARTVHHGLRRGVEPRGTGFGGKIKFKGVTYHSEEVWDTQEPAHQWHIAKYIEFHGTNGVIIKPKRNYPVWPPRKKDLVLRHQFTPEEQALVATF